MNTTLDVQWQPRNDLAIDIGGVDALGRHEIIPVPFNQARIATPTNPLVWSGTYLRESGCLSARAILYIRLHGPDRQRLRIPRLHAEFA